MELELITDPHKIPYCSLVGLKVSTIGRAFLGLSAAKFRELLRKAGADVETRARPSHDMIVVGENPSLVAEITILPFSGGCARPICIGHREFVIRFYPVLRHIEIGRGVTFEKHLHDMGAAELAS